MVTASTDKTVKLWDIGGNAPAAAGSKTMAIGDIFAASFYPSSGFLLAAGGSKGALAIWDTTENPAFVRRFEKRMKGEGAVLPPNLASAAATAATTTTTTVAAAAAAAPAVASDGAAAMGEAVSREEASGVLGAAAAAGGDGATKKKKKKKRGGKGKTSA